MLKGLKLSIIELILSLPSLLSTRTTTIRIGVEREHNVRQSVVSLKAFSLSFSTMLLFLETRGRRQPPLINCRIPSMSSAAENTSRCLSENRSQLIATQSRVHCYLLEKVSWERRCHHTFMCLSHSCLVNRIADTVISGEDFKSRVD